MAEGRVRRRRRGPTGEAAQRLRSAHRRSGTPVIAALLGLGPALVGLAGCADGATRDAEARAGESGLRGIALEEPRPAPDFTLVDTRGHEYRFREETEGTLVLLFFGYTNCPDICPVHMASLAAVLGDLPYPERRRVEVVFVTTDPARDTPERLRAWLDGFDPSFVGLVGDLETVNAIQARYDLPPAVRQETEDGRVLVGHASQVVAITPDGTMRAVYPSGIRQADWRHDLPRLLAYGEEPADREAPGNGGDRTGG